MVDKDGGPLMSCKSSKAKKLLELGIAILVNKSPYTIQVNYGINDDNKYAAKMKKIINRRGEYKNINNRVTILCSGGCGRSVTLRKSKVEKFDYYLCDSRKDGKSCREFIPKCPDGMITVHSMNAAAYFTGISYKIPTEEESASIARAKQIREAAIRYVKEQKQEINKNNIVWN
jgi:hypothetical protein